jgi:death-on-curing protein
LYPTLKEKAAALAHHIISRHVFVDGNKRTGIHICWAFLQSNDTKLALDLSIIELAETIARENDDDHKSLLMWLHDHQEEKSN